MRSFTKKLIVLVLSVVMTVGMTGTFSFATDDGGKTEKQAEKSLSAAAETLEDGTYTTVAGTDSKMFKVDECTVFVQDGVMSAVVTISGSGFNRLYLGTADKARTADKDEYLYFAADENDRYVFWPVPVAELDKPIKVAAHAYRDGRDTWYDHEITIKSANIKKVSDGIRRPSKKMEAKKYIEQYYNAGNIFAEHEDSVVKAGNVYTIPAYTDNGDEISELALLRPEENQFKAGWSFSNEDVFEEHKATDASFKIKERAEDVELTATVCLYKSNVSDESINDGTAEPLVTQSFELTLSSKPIGSTATIKAVNSRTGEDVDGVTFAVSYKVSRKKTVTVNPEEDGTYKLTPGTKYTVKATTGEGWYAGNSAEGHSYTGSFVPKRTDETFEVPVTPVDDAKDKIFIKVVDAETKEEITDAEVNVSVVSKGDIEKGADGSYEIWHLVPCRFSAKKDGYLPTSDSFTSKERENEVTVELRKPRTYSFFINYAAPAGYPDLENPEMAVYFDGKEDQPMTPEDGAYQLLEGERLKIVIKTDNYQEKSWFVQAKGDETTIKINETNFKPTDKTSFAMAIEEAKKTVDAMVEGTEPGQFQEGTKASLEAVITEAETLLAKEDAAKKEMDAAKKEITTAINSAYDEKEVPEKATVTVNAYIDGNRAPEKYTVDLTNETGAEYGKAKVTGVKNRVTLVDALVGVHRAKYADFDEGNVVTTEDGKKDEKYFSEGLNGQLLPTGKLFGKYGMDYGLAFRINGTGYSSRNNDVRRVHVADGDVIDLIVYNNNKAGSSFVFFEEPVVDTMQKTNFTMRLKGFTYNSSTYSQDSNVNDFSDVADATVTLRNAETGEPVTGVEPTNDSGKVIFNIEEPGKYELDSIELGNGAEVFYPECSVNVAIKPVSLLEVPFGKLSDRICTGKKIEQNISAMYEGEPVTFSVKYKNNVNVGIATVEITGTGKYFGKIIRTFRILPGKAKLAKVKAAKKKVTVKASKMKGGVSYEYSYRLGKGKWKTVKSKKASVKIRKLKSRRKYTFRVRAFRKVGKAVLRGAWSKTKTVKVK